MAVESLSGRPCPRDGRELVPAAQPEMGEMMMKLIEENRLLRQRLDMMGSGFGRPPSGALGLEAALHSPVSFAPEELRGQPVQKMR